MMTLIFQCCLIVGILIYLGVIVVLLKKQKLNLRYALTWLLMAFVMLLVAIFPQIITAISRLLGVASDVNTVFVLQGLFVLLILLSLTSIVSKQTNRIRKLAQTQALLEKRVRELEDSLRNLQKEIDNSK
ncbi:MAG: DUF2304 domain-containing protein [Oscillospiraceae bacterium]|jgi:hypothetical protein